jgi:hypothetical protein
MVREGNGIGIRMLSCKEVTRLVSESMDRTLPFGKRVGVHLHLRICRFCERYRRQFLLLREAAGRLTARADRPEGPSMETLSADARKRIAESLRNP